MTRKLFSTIGEYLSAAKAGNIWRISTKRVYSLMFQEKMILTQAEATVRQILSLDKLLSTIQKDLYAQNKSLHGKLHYELTPTIQLAKKLGAQKVTLIQKESLHYDALLTWSDNKNKKVECVTTMEHYDDSLRMEHLKLYHHAPAFHKIKYEGNKHKRRILELTPFKTFARADLKEKITKLLVSEIKKQFDKKLGKQKKPFIKIQFY